MVYGLDFEIESQLTTNSFVNDDYEVMSNTKIGTYVGDSQEELDEDTVKNFKKDFHKWFE